MLKLKLIQSGQEPTPELMGGNIMITPTLASSQLSVDLRPGICSSREF